MKILSLLRVASAGNGIADDAPAIRTAMNALATAAGGQLRLGCNSTYLVNSTASASFIHPKSNVSIVGCGPCSVIKVGDVER
jgi:polygalacturonase